MKLPEIKSFQLEFMDGNNKKLNALGETSKEVFSDVGSTPSDILAVAPQVKNKEELVSEILKREDLMSTAVGRGIAIPHVRLSSVTDLVMAVGICKNNIEDYQAVDGEPVNLLIMIAAAHNQHTYYLKTISYLTAKLMNPELRGLLKNASSPREAYDALVKD